MIERQVEIETKDGTMTTFEFHPEEGGPYPIVLYLMDAPSIRPALKDMASRLASAGYYVLLPFLYYRKSPYKEFGSSDEDMHERRELMQSVTREGILSIGRINHMLSRGSTHSLVIERSDADGCRWRFAYRLIKK